MDFKAFLLCFALFVVTASGSPFFRWKRDEPKNTVSKYSIKVKDGDNEVDETIEVDTDKETETFHIPDNGDNSTSAPGEVEVVYDFKLNLVMHRLSNQKACFLGNSTENLPKPADLTKLLDTDSSQGGAQLQSTNTDYEYMAAGLIDDRSILSDEMAALCAKLPIYRVDAIRKDVDKKTLLKRRKRSLYGCHTVRCCYWYCYRPNCCVSKCFYYWLCYYIAY